MGVQAGTEGGMKAPKLGKTAREDLLNSENPPIHIRHLDAIVDVVLAYKPPAKAKATKRREKRRAKRAQKKR